MKLKRKRYRDFAKTAVMSHLTSAILAVIFSGLILNLILNFYINSAIEQNVNIFSTDADIAKITVTVFALGALVNVPLEFCAMRFYLIISRKTLMQKATVAEFFAPFTNPPLLLKGSAIRILTTALTFLGLGILSLPIYFVYCFSMFVISDSPELSVFGAMKKSRLISKGHRWMTFVTILPFLLVYLFVTVAFGSMYLFGFFITSVVQSMMFVTYAVVYDGIRSR